MSGTASPRIVLLRPPRYLWPFNSETSAFWQPLGLLCLAAAVRRDLPSAQVEVWDCPGEKCGWRSLERRMAGRRIDVLGVGEETVSAHEALRAAGLAKRLHPGCLVVAGGVYFPYVIEPTLKDGRIDVVVRGEGERTFCELLAHLEDRGAWGTIAGLAFREDDGTIRLTPARPLIDRLDDLPYPAYELLDNSLYGRGSRNHPGLVSIEHSRGCVDSCEFCILWKQMGESVNGNGKVRPRYRTKSPGRSVDEVRRLYHDFGRRTFGWVDPTFNGSPDWSDGFAEGLFRTDLMDGRGRPRTVHTAWLRADGVIRDHRLGILGKLVRAGLRQVMIGVERTDARGMAVLGKHNNDPDVCREAFAIFREHHPEVFTIGTMIFGLPTDTTVDLGRIVRCQDEFGMDYCFVIPLTPNPGTAAADAAASEGRIPDGELARYNFITPVCTTDSLGLRQLERVYWQCMFRPTRHRVVYALKELLGQRDRRKRRVGIALLKHGTGIAVRSLLRAALRRKTDQPTSFSRKPKWYDT